MSKFVAPREFAPRVSIQGHRDIFALERTSGPQSFHCAVNRKWAGGGALQTLQTKASLSRRSDTIWLAASLPSAAAAGDVSNNIAAGGELIALTP